MNTSPLTQSTITSMIASDLNANQNSLQQLQVQLSTGQNISQPSDNPAGIEQLMGVSSTQTRFQQYQTNAQTGLIVAQLGNQTLNNAISVLQSARSTILAAGGPGITPQSAQGLIQNLQGDYNSLLGLANTAYLGNAIFAGTTGSSTAYDSSGNYLGNSQSPATTVSPGFSASTVVTSPFGTSGSSTNMFTAIQQAINDLQSGNYGAVYSTDLGNFDTAMSQVTSAAATQGEYVQQLTYMQNQSTQALQDVQAQYGAIQNVNMAQVTTEYSQQLSNYQIALNVASKSIEPTLAQFI
jgi:flagellar hook-associated protein 3 FlgL